MKQKGFAQIFIVILLLIAIGGVLYFGIKNGKITPTYSPSPIPTSAVSASNLASYADPNGQFSFSYDPSLTPEIDGDTVGFSGPDSIIFEVSKINTTETDPTMWWKGQQNSTSFPYPASCYSQTSVKNIYSKYDAKKLLLSFKQNVLDLTPNSALPKCQGPDGDSMIIASNNGKLFKIIHTYSAMGEQILSTFKFLGQTSTIPGWKNYTNSMYNYSIQYPTAWTEASSKPEFINVPGELAIIPPSEETPVGVQAQVDIVVSADKTPRYNFYTDSDFQTWLNKTKDTNTIQQVYKLANITVAGLNAVQLVQQTLPQDATEPYYSIVTWFRSGGKSYYIENGGISPAKVQAYMNDYNQILSTFKFTN